MPILSYFPVNGGSVMTALSVVPSQSGSLTYTGEEQSPLWADYDPQKLNLTGVVSATDAGTYVALFTPVYGYCWEDLSVEAREVEWTVSKAEGKATASVLSISLDTVSNTSSSFTVARLGDGAINASSSNTSVAEVSVSGSVVTVTAVGGGSATVTLSVAEGSNHTAAAPVTVDVTCVYVWGRYSVVENTLYSLYVESQDGTPEEVLEMLDSGEIDRSDCDESLLPISEGGSYPSGWAGYGDVSVDSEGNIVGESSSSVEAADYLHYSYSSADDWYLVGDVSSSGKLYLYALSVESYTETLKGEYITDVTSPSSSAYPDNGVKGGYWYVRK